MKLNKEKFYFALASKEMNTSDLARETGYSLNTIRAYANMKRVPTTKAIGKIARVLCIDVAELIEKDE